MAGKTVNSPPASGGKRDKNLPGSLSYNNIQSLFQKSGIFGQKLSIQYRGNLYRVSCDDHAFIVYQVNQHQGLPPGIPGWLVCMVDFKPISQKYKPSSKPEDYFIHTLEVNNWLEIIRQYCCS